VGQPSGQDEARDAGDAVILDLLCATQQPLKVAMQIASEGDGDLPPNQLANIRPHGLPSTLLGP
jgi:hypothetical protein